MVLGRATRHSEKARDSVTNLSPFLSISPFSKLPRAPITSIPGRAIPATEVYKWQQQPKRQPQPQRIPSSAGSPAEHRVPSPTRQKWAHPRPPCPRLRKRRRATQKRKGCGAHRQMIQEQARAALRFARSNEEPPHQSRQLCPLHRPPHRSRQTALVAGTLSATASPHAPLSCPPWTPKPTSATSGNLSMTTNPPTPSKLNWSTKWPTLPGASTASH